MKKRQIKDIIAAALLAAGTTAIVGAEGTEAKATALLARLRQAIGGEAKLSSLKGLSLQADMRRVLPGEGSEPGPEMSGEVTLDFADAKRYLFIDSFSPMAGMPPISIGTAINGDDQWTGPVSAPMAGVMLRTEGSNDPGRLRTRIEKDMTRLSIALLAGSNVPGVAFTYGGVAESPEGRAEVLDVTGPGGFKGKLFLDEKTARPMMLSYFEIPRRMAMRRGGPGAPPPQSAGGGHGDPNAPAAAAAAPELKEAQMFLSDYKTEDGISFPRSVTIKVQDGPTEEWTVQKIKLNPVFGADHFKKR
jgi:hypothetical protein